MVDRGRPIGIAVIEQPDHVVLAEDYGEQVYTGIEIDSLDADEVRRLLKVNEKRLISTWRTYATQRGGGYALVDLWKLASAIRRCRPLLNIDRLRYVSDAFELMHGRYQAELMAEAVVRHPGKVALCRKKAKNDRVGDFLVQGREFEVKTIQTLGTVEQRRTGWTVAQVTADKLVKDLRRKAKQGFQQIAASGTVVCVAWCDFVGLVVAQELAEFKVAGSDVFEDHRYVVGARNEVGRDLWFGFATDGEWESALAGLEANLNTQRHRSLPLSAQGVTFWTNSEEWMSIGRPMRIDGSRQYEN